MKQFVNAWLARPLESRKAVANELLTMAVGWSDQSVGPETQEDGATLQVIVDMLESVDEAAFVGG